MIFRNWFDNEPKETMFCAVVSLIALILSLGGWGRELIPVDTAWIAIVLCGIPIVTGAAVALIREHDIKADLLVSIALIASVATREYFAAGEVALIMQIGSLLEDFTADRDRKGIEGLIRLTPKTARVVRSGIETIVAAEEVRAGDRLVVLAGEMIPADGILVSGETSVDQSVMTGESMPVDKSAGDELMSGTVNLYGVFEMQADKACADSSLQRMIALAEEADANKAPIVGLADRWASWMVAIALGCALIVWLITGEFMRAVTVLVVFCPCAFVLATPTAVAAAIGNLTKYGILIRTGDALERLSQVDCAAFDKTGTLTCGKPEVTAVESFGGMSRDEVLSLTAAAEQRSEHPLGKAVVSYYKASGIESKYVTEAGDFQTLAGKGVRAKVDDHEILAGKPALFDETGISLADHQALLDRYQADGSTVICTAVNGSPVGMVALSDTLRPDAVQTVAGIKSVGITPMLLTGDNAAAAGTVCDAVGIGEVRSGLLPEDKLNIVRREGGRKVCMIGDGVNDAPAISAAYAGIAMGGIGSDIAVESADAVLVGDEISRLPYLFRLTKKAMRKVRQNITFSMIFNFAAIILSGFGILTPVTAALVHNFGSVFVVVNAAMLLAEKDGGEQKRKERGSAATQAAAEQVL